MVCPEGLCLRGNFSLFSGKDVPDDAGHILAHFPVVVGDVQGAVALGHVHIENDLREPPHRHEQDPVLQDGGHEHGAHEAVPQGGDAAFRDLADGVFHCIAGKRASLSAFPRFYTRFI